MIIGAAGGYEVLSSLYYDAGHVDAIELNPVTYHLVTDDYADYSGHLAEHPKVNFVNGDGRSYLARSKGGYDLVWFPAPDSYAASSAANAGAFVLSESYLYTSDAIKDSLEHLAPGGIVATQFGERDYENKPNRTSRYVATARDALADFGVSDPSDHIMVATSPTDLGAATVSTILVKKTPFTDAEVSGFVDALGNVEGSVLRYAPGHAQDNSVSTIATATPEQLDAFFDSYPYDVTAISDNRPFFWHFRSFGPVLSNITDSISTSDWEDTVGERVLLLLLVIATLMAAVFLLLPFVTIRRDWSELPRKGISVRLLRDARPRVHVLRDHADPAAHAVPRLPDVLADRHADVTARLRRDRRAAQRADQATRASEPAVPVRRDRAAHRSSISSCCPRSPTGCSAARSRCG